MLEEKELNNNVKQNMQLEQARKRILLLTKIQCDSGRPTSRLMGKQYFQVKIYKNSPFQNFKHLKWYLNLPFQHILFSLCYYYYCYYNIHAHTPTYVFIDECMYIIRGFGSCRIRFINKHSYRMCLCSYLSTPKSLHNSFNVLNLKLLNNEHGNISGNPKLPVGAQSACLRG